MRTGQLVSSVANEPGWCFESRVLTGHQGPGGRGDVTRPHTDHKIL